MDGAEKFAFLTENWPYIGNGKSYPAKVTTNHW